MRDTVLGMRRPDAGAPRPYDNELVPALKWLSVLPGVAWRAVAQTAPWVARFDFKTYRLKRLAIEGAAITSVARRVNSRLDAVRRGVGLRRRDTE